MPELLMDADDVENSRQQSDSDRSRLRRLSFVMYKDLDETVSVLVVFEKGDMRPLRFYWKDQVFKVTRVTGRWKAPQGETWTRHFSVVDSSDNVFFLTYEERSMRWAISKVWVG